MTLAADLLKQAERLAKLERKRPKQASLRRSVSSAYYSLFHLLIEEGARIITTDIPLCPYIARVYQHGDIKKICEVVSRPLTHNSHWLGKFFEFPIDPDLISVCQAFMDLQELRHSADYDLSRTFKKSEAIGVVSRALAAHEDWKKVRNAKNAKLLLLASAKILVNR